MSYEFSKLRALPIAAVARDLGISTRGRGEWLTAKCPWHEDKNPSLKLNTRSNTCHCFACGNGGSPIDLVMQVEGVEFLDACAWLCQTYCVDTLCPNNHSSLISNLVPKARLTTNLGALPPLTLFAIEIAERYQSENSNFCRCLRHYFSDEVVQRVVEQYHLGMTEEGDVMFPSIDGECRVRDFKIQRYGTDPGQPDFFHSDHTKVRWWAGLLQKTGKIPPEARIDRDCLFGEHLLAQFPSATVVLVESPKNAVVGAAALPDFVWVAVGNRSMLKRSLLTPLRARRVIVMPDCDAYAEWESLIADMQDLAHFTMSSFQRIAEQSGNKKFDVADFLLSEKKVVL